jgi:hypothetical protein
MIKFSSLVGALIAFLTCPMELPTNLRADSGELTFFMAPVFQIAGLMCLIATPKPPRASLKEKKGKERFLYEYKYPGDVVQSFFNQIVLMLSQFFSWEFLALFPFVFVSATYVSEIECSFQLYLMNIAGYHYDMYINGNHF